MLEAFNFVQLLRCSQHVNARAYPGCGVLVDKSHVHEVKYPCLTVHIQFDLLKIYVVDCFELVNTELILEECSHVRQEQK